jgi:multicomponent Na+:H+ antiporter subunit C
MTAYTIPYLLSFVLVLLGFYTVLSYRDLIKVICGLSISGYGVNILLVQMGYVEGASSPVPPMGATVVDPLLQALVVTAIVIEFGLMMLVLSMAIKIFRETGEMDIGLLRRLRG